MTFFSRFNNLLGVFLLQVALPVFLLLGALLAIALELIGNLTEDRLQRDLRQVARAVQLPVAQALERNDFSQLSSSLASVFEISEVYGAYLFDVNGQRLVSFGSVNPSRSQLDRALEMTAEGEREFDLYEQISGRNVYSFFLPLFDAAGQPNGLLQVTRRRSDIEAELERLRTRAWLGFGVVFLLMLGCLVASHQWGIGRHLNRLLSSMQRVESGDRKHRAALRGPREMQQLAAALNTMLDAIIQAEQEALKQHAAREAVTEKLRQAETMAALGQVSAGVAHELGAPLSVVDGRANRLLRKDRDTQDRRELQAIRQQVGRMSALVQQLLSFGRSSRAPHTDLPLEELFERLRALAAEEQWEIDFRPGPPARIEADPFSMEQAVANLLRNARQACPEGTVRAGWRVEGDPDKVVIFVEDAGPGLDASLGSQVFEPFVTTKTPGQGSGMGLAIVQRVVRDHQGEIRAGHSELGGACFELFLPLVGKGARAMGRSERNNPREMQ